MKFEEALTAMRSGAKIRHSSFAEDEYLVACRVGLIGDNNTPLEEKPISIAKIKGDRLAGIMEGKLNYVAKIKRLENSFKKINYKYIPREQNKEADQLVNIALDKKLYGT